MKQVLVIITLSFSSYLFGQQKYYNGNTVIHLKANNRAEERVCKYYYSSIHARHPSIKSKYKRFGKWQKDKGGVFLINDEKLTEIIIGEIRLLVSNNGIDDFNEVEELCINAVMSIAYEEVRMNSENEAYIIYRDKAIKNIQFLRLLNVLESSLGNIWIEIPPYFGENYLCYKLLNK